MQYVRSISGSVSKTWNSINPATLSGAIDVIVVEHPDGTLACSPFHVRFGKFSLLRPSDKKVEFRVHDVPQDYAMKLGEGGEAFFVFQTIAAVPQNLQTSPLVSPEASPVARPLSSSSDPVTSEPEPLTLDDPPTESTAKRRPSRPAATPLAIPGLRPQTETGHLPEPSFDLLPPDWQRKAAPKTHHRTLSTIADLGPGPGTLSVSRTDSSNRSKSQSPGLRPRHEAVTRAKTLSDRLRSSNITSHVNEEGDLMLDMTGYKSSEETSLRAELVARQILSEEYEGFEDIGSLIGADEKGNLWIYNSEEAKEAASRKSLFSGMTPAGMMSTDALSDPGYHSDDTESQKGLDVPNNRERSESDSAVGLISPPESPAVQAADASTSYAKTLRLTSDQLKALKLRSGANPMSFTVNRARCQANMYLWRLEDPIVVSDVDGTITKSDALGHVLNMIGRDWTHLGVAKLYTDIVNNGYNVLYLTSRSVGQADTTRAYLNGIVQDGYKLPKGPVIMSPDRTIAALRREIYLRKPEVFKMACLRDIMSLFHPRKTPFYAGFGNRLTDALSYRSVNIPSIRIFTINSNAEVSLDLLSLNKYKTGYTSMPETIDHFFPPTGMLVHEGGEEYTDFNYWRDKPLELDQLSLSDAGEQVLRPGSPRSDEDYSDGGDDDVLSDELADSYLSRESIDDSLVLEVARSSVEGQLDRIQSAEDGSADADDLNEEDTAIVAVTKSNGQTEELRTNLQDLHEALAETYQEVEHVHRRPP
ncbi:MAG: hypothetical protein M1828_006690 [Chrysothrix sp. TS-e1954]|nr:MAG: hypothetical protein M1828_006690 [Chrysothrix sp. TS-e1954]